MLSLRELALKRPRDASASALGRDLAAGAIAAMVTIAYCISYSALIFQGPIASGFLLGLAALLTGTVVTGVYVSLTTSLAPADAGPDTPAVAVMSVLAASIAGSLAARGVSPELSVIHVLIAISLSTLLTGILLFAVGALKLGIWLRFVPYPVIGGFLAASGWLLMTGGVEVMTGFEPSLSPAAWREFAASDRLPQLMTGLSFALLVYFVRRRVRSFIVLPVLFFAFLLVLDVVLLGIMGGDTGTRSGWFLQGLGELSLWLPVQAAMATDIDWSVLAANAAEIGAVCGVTAISMLLDVSSLEVARQKSADLDHELRTNGLANIVASVFGGVAGNLSLNNSILINEAGAMTRWAGVFAALFASLVFFVGGDIASFVPKPLLGGLLAYLGLVVFTEALLRSPAQRSWTDLILAAAITMVIVNAGYLMGVALGVIGACLMFALSYSRIGVVRRHLTRRDFASNVDRAPDQGRLLSEEGERIHLFWLSGFIFFGSSNGLFERIRRCIDTQRDKPVKFVVLDFSGVPGLDTSAVLSLVKLRNYCDEHGVALAFSGLTDVMRAGFQKAGFFVEERAHRLFGSRNEALEWCEDALLSNHDFVAADADSFETWLSSELGSEGDIERLIAYFARREIEPGEMLFRQGDPSDTVELIASGSVAIVVHDDVGRPVRLRRMSAQTVVGEMGFYRGAARAASVVGEGGTVVYRLTREAFLKMQADDPKAATAFHQFIIRVLADRLEFANREIAALL